MKSSVPLSSPKTKVIKKEKLSPKKKSTPVVVKKQKSIALVKKNHSVKRYGKQVIRNILLSKVFHTLFKVFMGIVIFSAVSYGLYSYFTRSIVNDVVVSKSEIVERVAKLTILPKGLPDAVVRVEDPETLKKQNSFYENVKDGDYIVMYPKVAVIYDLRNNSIVAVKNVEGR